MNICCSLLCRDITLSVEVHFKITFDHFEDVNMFFL